MSGSARSVWAVNAWPAAKYLSYAFWRAWFLVIYSAPIWGHFAFPENTEPGFAIYCASTACFAAVSFLFSAFHEKVIVILASKPCMIAFGLLASVSVAMVFGVLIVCETPDTPLFWVAGGMTGICTVPLALRAGQIYSSTRVSTVAICTLLSDAAAGLIFFFCMGTWTSVCLTVVVLLPTLSALMTLVSSPGSDSISQGGSVSASAAKTARRSFVRFATVFFVIGFAAFLLNDMSESWFSSTSLSSGRVLGISLLVMASFAMAFVFGVVRSVAFDRMFRPIVVILVAFVAIAYSGNFGSSVGVAGIFLAYCLFSSYIWCFSAYLGRSRYFTPIQVFGTVRGAYSAGSLVACLAGSLLVGESTGQLAPIVAVSTGVLLLCVVAVRREDISSLLIDVLQSSDASAAPSPAGEDEEVPLEDAPAALAIGREKLPEGVRLTPREREVYVLLVAGRDSEYIANSLCMSRNTAKTHIKNIYAKFGVHKRQEFIDAVQNL